MKLNYDQLFVGNLHICTEYENHFTCKFEGDLGSGGFGRIETETELYKENVLLVKIAEGAYVELDKINTIFDELKIKFNVTKNGVKNIPNVTLFRSPSGLNNIYVDENSLKPYYMQVEDSAKKVSHKTLKKNL